MVIHFCTRLHALHSPIGLFRWRDASKKPPPKDVSLTHSELIPWHSVHVSSGRGSCERERSTEPSDICCGVWARSDGRLCQLGNRSADCSRFAFGASVNNVGFPLRGGTASFLIRAQ